MHQCDGSCFQPRTISIDIVCYYQSECYFYNYSRQLTILQDVIDSDAEEIIDEYVAHVDTERVSNPFRFLQKFQSIIQQKCGENFISKLHRGKLDIIPWPFIESSWFYDLFGVLKNRFDRQPITHQRAGTFLVVLKMLMAKLKVCALVISMLESLTIERQTTGEPLTVSRL
jgi:hypothetical protein